MSEQPLTATIKAEMKVAMKARDKERLSAIRLVLAEFKRIEVDERIEVDDARALAVLDKMVNDAGREELAAVENAEIIVLQEFLPSQLSAEELIAMVDAAIAASGATGMQAMGPVMGQLKPQLAGRADVGAVSKLVKERLTA